MNGVKAEPPGEQPVIVVGRAYRHGSDGDLHLPSRRDNHDLVWLTDGEFDVLRRSQLLPDPGAVEGLTVDSDPATLHADAQPAVAVDAKLQVCVAANRELNAR